MAGFLQARIGLLLAASATGIAEPTASRQADDRFPIVELRQYTLHDGQRDVLIDLFEREFVESQEALGMKVIGTFTDLDRPNRFVWIRGFHDMDARLVGLSAFYGGPIWKAHSAAANETMIDSDNVLLLEAPNTNAQFTLPPTRPALGESTPAGLVTATIYYLKVPPSEAASQFRRRVAPRLAREGVRPLAWFITETATNNFPRLPVREGERVVVWFAAFTSDADRKAHRIAFVHAAMALAPLLSREPEVLRLKPTSRSLIRGSPKP